jgi:hypothetical protein
MIVRTVLLMAAALGVLLEGAVRAPERLQAEKEKKPCCFQHPGYAGTCKVQPAEDETCATILAYLNNPMAEGKSYCGGTTVRGGWTEVRCDAEDTEGRDSGALPRALP